MTKENIKTSLTGLTFNGTKGKWKCSDIMNFSDTLISFINSNNNRSVAQLRGCGTGEEKEAIANARLIASAPELLEITIKRYKKLTSLKQQDKLSDGESKEYTKIEKLLKYILV